MASVTALELGSGWRLVGPRTEYLSGFSQCNSTHPHARPRCAPHCLSKKAFESPDTLCATCDCRLCLYCSQAENKWVAPSGQVLHTLTTNTEPRFVFAFNPLDDDMRRLRTVNYVLEPALTHAWHDQTWECCARDGLVVDVGGNFGWFTLYSLALGCRVRVFEPAPLWQEVLKLGVTLNPGFRERLTIYSNVVYDRPGMFRLMVPRPKKGQLLGMTGMIGDSGLIKGYKDNADEIRVPAVAIDDVVDEDACLLKADIEGYEPQALKTATRLLSTRKVPAVQLELTKSSFGVNWPLVPEVGGRHLRQVDNQTCLMLQMLWYLEQAGYDMRIVGHAATDKWKLPARGEWRQSPAFDSMPHFPSARARALAKSPQYRLPSAIGPAFFSDFTAYSTNVVGRRGAAHALQHAQAARPWPPSGAEWMAANLGVRCDGRLRKANWNGSTPLGGRGRNRGGGTARAPRPRARPSVASRLSSAWGDLTKPGGLTKAWDLTRRTAAGTA